MCIEDVKCDMIIIQGTTQLWLSSLCTDPLPSGKIGEGGGRGGGLYTIHRLWPSDNFVPYNCLT